MLKCEIFDLWDFYFSSSSFYDGIVLWAVEGGPSPTMTYPLHGFIFCQIGPLKGMV